MKYIIDIDGTICKEVLNDDGSKDYSKHIPQYDRIQKINKLYDEGNEIKYWTARGAVSGLDWAELTKNQLKDWGCKYHKLSVGDKPHYDLWIDDKAINSEEFFK